MPDMNKIKFNLLTLQIQSNKKFSRWMVEWYLQGHHKRFWLYIRSYTYIICKGILRIGAY
jgi:hypothetical protein